MFQSFCVAILSYNHPEHTSRCLNSVLRHNPQLPIYLLHNGSLKNHKDFLIQNYNEVQHLVLEKNRGFSGGANFLLKSLFKKYDWVFFLTNDTVVESPFELNLNSLKFGFYAPRIMHAKKDLWDSYGAFVNLKTSALQHIRHPEELSQIKSPSSNLQFYIPGTAFLMHKNFFEITNGFQESLGTYWEDVELSLRAQKLKLPLEVLNPSPVIRHSVGKTCHKDSEYTIYYFHRNKMIVCWNYSTSIQKIHLFFNFIKSYFKISFRLLKNSRQKDFLLSFKAFKDSFSVRL